MSDYHPPHPTRQGYPGQAAQPGQARTRRSRPPDAPPRPNAYPPEPQEWRGTPAARPAQQQPPSQPWAQWERTPMRGAQAPVYPAAQGGRREPARNQPA
ncbi:MAG: hypothetical protein FWE77_05940, partial [Clostridia bacterium]|nr:hypothetical protein [Clostridia bacterium]